MARKAFSEALGALEAAEATQALAGQENALASDLGLARAFLSGPAPDRSAAGVEHHPIGHA
jgi:hypothetical protein